MVDNRLQEKRGRGMGPSDGYGTLLEVNLHLSYIQKVSRSGSITFIVFPLRIHLPFVTEDVTS